MDQRNHMLSGSSNQGMTMVSDQGAGIPRPPYYYDYQSMGGIPPGPMQPSAYYAPSQHAPLLDTGGLGDPTCGGVTAALWNGTSGNPYGSPSSSSSYASGGAPHPYYGGYDYYVCNNMAAYYPSSGMPPSVSTSGSEYPSQPPQLAPSVTHNMPTAAYYAAAAAPSLLPPPTSTAVTSAELPSTNGVNMSSTSSADTEHPEMRRDLYASPLKNDLSYNQMGARKSDLPPQGYAGPVDANSLAASMQHMSLHQGPAVPPSTLAGQHANYRHGLASHQPPQDPNRVPMQLSRNGPTNDTYSVYPTATSSNSGPNKSWACIAGQPPRGSAALGNSIVSIMGAATLVNGSGASSAYPLETSPEGEEKNVRSPTSEESPYPLQYQMPMYSPNREHPPQMATTQGNGRQNGGGHFHKSSHPSAAYPALSRGGGSFEMSAMYAGQQQQPQQALYVTPPAATAPFTPIPLDGSRNMEDAKKLLASLRHSLNRPDFDFDSIKLARVFVIKSFSEEDVHRSMKYGVWCSTERGNERLHQAYHDMQMRGGGRVFLCFSVNGSGHFCGFCEMISDVNMEKRCGIWAEPRWRGEIRVRWHFVKDVPNSELRHIRVESNENKSVTNSRDCTEVTPLEKGLLLMRLIAKYKHRTCILDDFLHYESKEMDVRNSLLPMPRP